MFEQVLLEQEIYEENRKTNDLTLVDVAMKYWSVDVSNETNVGYDKLLILMVK